MPDKKKNEITDEEMKDATGGAGYSVSSEKTANRAPNTGKRKEDDFGGETDPVYGGELGDKALGGTVAGTSTTPGSQKPSDAHRESNPTKSGGGNAPKHGSMGGQVK